MSVSLASWITGITRALRLMLGAPDYDRYIAHLREAHPECAPLSRMQFDRERMEARYSRPGSRCC